ALVIAWSTVALIVLAALGFVMYLLYPTVRGGTGSTDPSAEMLDIGTVAPAPTTTRPAGRAQLSGTVERVEGQVLVVKATGHEPVRVLVRGGAPMGRITEGAVGDLRPGEPVAVTLTPQSDGRLLATRVRVQPASVPIPTPAGEPRPAGLLTVAGTVISMEGNRLTLRTATGERAVELTSGVRVTRFVPIALTDLTPGLRVAVEGEYLVDGSLAALVVQIFGGP
ncbi:MAG: hypothetical protein C4290_07885, partial [Chloroflexota bacterium]